MVNRLLAWLFDLQDIHLGKDAPILFDWTGGVPAWALSSFGAAAFAWVWLVYRREQASSGRRLALGIVRGCVIALAVTLLCGPVLILQRNRVEPAFVSLAIDNSLSMNTIDTYTNEELADSIVRGAGLANRAQLAHLSRLDLIKAAFTRDDAAPLDTLIKRNTLHLASFAGASETRAVASSRQSLGILTDALEHITPRGQTTNLAGAIRNLIDNTRGRRLAAIILATDGQSTEPTGLREAIDLARGRQVPIYALRIGSTVKPRDIEVGPLRAEDRLFVKDRLVIEARVTARGLVEPTTIDVRLYDERSSRPIDARQITLDGSTDSVTIELYDTPKRVGRHRYRVEAAPIPNEKTTANNVDYIDLTIVDDQVRVLYVEGYPRYEYRYLKNALLREPTVEVSILLIEADERFVQDGTLPIRRFPQTPEELHRYDLVIFGDVDPRGGWLSAAQMRMLLDYVGNEGGGFGVIAGERHAPQRFLGTPLEKLLPIRIDPNQLGRAQAPLSTGYRPRLTSDGRRNRLFRLNAFGQSASQGTQEIGGRDLQALPDLFWIARTLGPKPGASVLAEHPDLLVPSELAIGRGLMPLVVVGRYGAGKIFFQATDDTWRWRRHTGEFLHDTYWIQVTREIARVERSAEDRRLSIRTDRKVYDYGSSIHVEVHVTDSQLLAEHPETLRVNVQATGPNSAARDPRPSFGGDSNTVRQIEVHRLGPNSNRYEGVFVAPTPGQYAMRVDGVGQRIGTRGPSASLRVNRPDLEARRIEANHDVLKRIAEETNGALIDLDELIDVCSTIPDRSVQIPDDVTEPLWDSKIALALFAVLLTIEWVLRKATGLQ